MTQRVAEFRCMHERAKEESTSPLALAFRLEALALPLLDRIDKLLITDPDLNSRLFMQICDLKDAIVSLRECIYDLTS